jgi:hypothetical protein
MSASTIRSSPGRAVQARAGPARTLVWVDGRRAPLSARIPSRAAFSYRFRHSGHENYSRRPRGHPTADLGSVDWTRGLRGNAGWAGRLDDGLEPGLFGGRPCERHSHLREIRGLLRATREPGGTLMKHISLGGLDVSRIGLGTMAMSGYYLDPSSSEAESIRTIHRGLEHGRPAVTLDPSVPGECGGPRRPAAA